MREFIDAVSAILFEGKVHKLDRVPTPWGGEFSTIVYENPSATQMEAVTRASKHGAMRGLIDTDGTVYIWPSEEAGHMNIIMGMHLRDPLPFMLYDDRGLVESEWLSVPLVGKNRGITLQMSREAYEEVAHTPMLKHLFPISLAAVTESS